MSFNLTRFQNHLLDWFINNRRDLPWRRKYEPYEVWVAEIMLQQTQMERGVDYFQRWMHRFPDLEALHSAPEQEIFKCWEGLGYYSRARNIQRCAVIVMEKHGGRLPQTTEELQKLPGIGPYTAGAISSIAFNRTVPVVDGNIGRIFARVFNIEEPLRNPAVKKMLWAKAEEILPEGRARDFNQALMELGALICSPRKPSCGRCPVSDDCFACRFDAVHARPVKGEQTEILPIVMATGVLLDRGKVFIQQRLAKDIWGGLWEFPGGTIEKGETPEQAVVREFMEETGFAVDLKEKITTVVHHFTRYKVTLHSFFCTLAGEVGEPVLTSAQDFRRVKPVELEQYAFPAGHRKVIEFLREKRLLSFDE